MRDAFALGVLTLAVLTLVSCGIETVSVLPSPDVDYRDQQTTVKMELVHDADLYDDTDFLGYQVYYRIYPKVTGIEGSTRLVTDATTLNSGPLATLQGMGYKALTQSKSNEAKFTTQVLQIADPKGGATILLDFSDFLDAANLDATNVQPQLLINGQVSQYVYRTTALNSDTEGLQRFSRLRSDPKAWTEDTASLSSGKIYEVEVFVVAYGLTASLETIYSTPRAWGTIQYIQP